MKKYFKATQSQRDSMFYLRVTESSKGPLGNLVDKTGFLKFESQADADAALDTLNAGDADTKLGAALPGGLFQIIAVASPVEQTADIEHA